MQAYGSLALKDNSEVGEAGCVIGSSISCACAGAFYFRAMKESQQIAMGPSGREYGDFTSCEARVESQKDQLQNWPKPPHCFSVH